MLRNVGDSDSSFQSYADPFTNYNVIDQSSGPDIRGETSYGSALFLARAGRAEPARLSSAHHFGPPG